MQARNTPSIGGRYWVAITVASVFGANLGDFVSHVMHLGHVRGLPVLALILAVLLVAERRSAITTEAWYWATIVVLRTAATNLADLATHDLKLNDAWVILALENLLLLLTLRRASGRNEKRGLPPVNGWYWAAMLTAGTLGTGIGDCVADDLGFGVAQGSVLLGAVLAVTLIITGRAGWATGAAYWTSIVAVRSAGTTVGDFLAGGDGLALGLAVSTACTGLLLAATLLLWRPRSAAAARARLGAE